MIEDFGSYLKSERELRGVPLEEVSTTTRIPIRFLQALENNKFDELPGEVFIKGYIRSICKVIGFDEDEMLSAYNEAVNKPSSNIKDKNFLVEGKAEDKTAANKNFIFKLGLIVIFLAGLGWGVNFLVQKSREGLKKSKPTIFKKDQKKIGQSPRKNLSDSAAVIEDGSASLKKTGGSPKTSNKMVALKSEAEKQLNNLSIKPIQLFEDLSATNTKEDDVLETKVDSGITAGISNNKNKNRTSTSVDESDMPLKLSIKVEDNVWFNITVDESRGEDFILPKGTVKTFYGKDNFRITLGNRNVVDLKLNDKTLNLPDGDENSVLREFIINAQLIE